MVISEDQLNSCTIIRKRNYQFGIGHQSHQEDVFPSREGASKFLLKFTCQAFKIIPKCISDEQLNSAKSSQNYLERWNYHRTWIFTNIEYIREGVAKASYTKAGIHKVWVKHTFFLYPSLKRMYDKRLTKAYRPNWSPGLFELNLKSL